MRGSRTGSRRLASRAFALALAAACAPAEAEPVLTVSGSALGAEGAVLTRQIGRFMAENPGVRVVIQHTPDDTSQRHQLYVQWLNGRVGQPDILQFDVIRTPEFASADWILPLDRFAPQRDAFFPATLEANTWRGELYALPWFVDVGMLYWRTDLLDAPPASLQELVELAQRATQAPGAPRNGLVWQGARCEGLVTGFVEYSGGFGGSILTPGARVVVDSPEAVQALNFMRDQVMQYRIAPREVLTWREEETRFAFQNGTALFMRNWPYASAIVNEAADSRVAGRFAIAPSAAAGWCARRSWCPGRSPPWSPHCSGASCSDSQAGIANAVLVGAGRLEQPLVWFARASTAWVPVILAVLPPTQPLREEETVTLAVPPEPVHLFRASDGARMPLDGVANG